MTEPTVPLRFELTVEVPGRPEQVWDAIATANGISAWMFPTDMEERLGGTVVFHMGDDVSSKGVITGWDPPRRIVYEEDWATLVGQDPTTVTPLVSDFLVEAKSGGTCVVRVVSSAFGSGADWEREFFAAMTKGWAPTFEHLRLYLTYFAGQRVTTLEVWADVPGSPAEVVTAMRNGLGIEQSGHGISARGVVGQVERVGEDNVLLRITDPVPGLLSMSAWRAEDENKSSARLAGYLFSDGAPAYVERERPAWKAWLESLVPAGARSGG
jgi:uncharacterized protein YndB with AHSA1/START domain